MHSIKQYIHCRRHFPIFPVTSLDSDRRSSVVLNVQCLRECPRDDFRTFIQLIQQVFILETRHTNALYQTVYSLPPSLSCFSRDVTGRRRRSTRRFPHIYPINSAAFKTGNKAHQCTLSNSVFTAAVNFLFFVACNRNRRVDIRVDIGHSQRPSVAVQ